MLVKLLLVCSAVGLAKPGAHTAQRGYPDGAVHSSKPQAQDTSAHPQRTPLPHQGGSWEAEGLREDTQDYPSSHEDRGDFESVSPQPQNG